MQIIQPYIIGFLFGIFFVFCYLMSLSGNTSEEENGPPMSQTLNDWTYEEIPFRRNDTTPEDTGSLPFSNAFRNPCWLETNDSNITIKYLRCLPYFYLAGFPKCGTTDLHGRMVQHPLISEKCNKEFHWLTRKRFEGKKLLSNYLAYFDTSVKYDISGIQENGFHTAIFGDCSASTVWDNRNLMIRQMQQNKTEPELKNANVIFRLNPRAKIIIMLRDPTSRLFSEYAYFKIGNTSVEDFHSRVVSAISAFKRCLMVHHIYYCAVFNHFQVRLQVGMYYLYIEDYFQVFPKEQIKIIKLEDYAKNRFNYMRDIFEFLGVGMPPPNIMDKVVKQNEANTNTQKKETIGDMLTKTRQLLDTFYKPYNRRLVKLLGNDFNYNN